MKHFIKNNIYIIVLVMGFSIILYGCRAYTGVESLVKDGIGDRPRKFGATYMNMSNPFFGILNGGIEEVVGSNGDILITRDPAQNQEKQNEQILEMIDEGVEAVFLNPVDWKKVKPALKACRDAGIPVFNIDTLVYNTDYITSAILSDNYNAGVLCAKDMMSKLDSADIVILDQPETYSITERVKGFMETINGNENYYIVKIEDGGGELEVSMKAMDRIIESGFGFDVVLGGNDPTALGALAALESKHIKNVLIYGIDGSPDGKKMIRKGILEGTSTQSPNEIGRTAAETAYAYLRGEEIERYVEVPVTLVTQDNLSDFDINGWQ